MPKPLKKRGRRAERQLYKAEQIDGPPTKKRKTAGPNPIPDQFNVDGDVGDDFISFGQEESQISQAVPGTTTFYGLLTEDEQQYYTNVNAKLSANDFNSDDDKKLFIDAVHRDLAGKEIKIASSQSCSRFLERLIAASTPSQLGSLFHAFLQDLNYLIQHRFGSHCCEALFLSAAKHVSSTMEHPSDDGSSIESCFLKTAEQLKDNIGYLLTERFASHTVRLLLLILSGEPLDDHIIRDVVASRKKEKLETDGEDHTTYSSEIRKVPNTFKKAWKDLVRSAVSVLDSTYLRALATHPTGSPVLQLLLKLESSDPDAKEHRKSGILVKLIPDLDFDIDSESSKFVSSLVYDSTGAHLVQTLVKVLPGKPFKKMYKSLFRERIGKLAKNEIASYVAVSIFERVGKEDLDHACRAVIQELPGLFERNRLAVVRQLIERCSVRAVDLSPMAKALEEVCNEDGVTVLLKMLTSPASTEPVEDLETAYDNLQGSLLAQTMLRTEQLAHIIQESILSLTDQMLKSLAKNTISSRPIQVSLTTNTASAKFRRLLIPRFYTMVDELAVHSSGSHLIDALWTGTEGSHFMKERIAKILQEHEHELRDSLYGRAIWRNWDMDTYQRRPSEWHANAKRTRTNLYESKADVVTRTPIQRARERYMQNQSRNPQQNSTSDTAATA